MTPLTEDTGCKIQFIIIKSLTTGKKDESSNISTISLQNKNFKITVDENKGKSKDRNKERKEKR